MASNINQYDAFCNLFTAMDISQQCILFTPVKMKIIANKAIVTDFLVSFSTDSVNEYLEVLNKDTPRTDSQIHEKTIIRTGHQTINNTLNNNHDYAVSDTEFKKLVLQELAKISLQINALQSSVATLVDVQNLQNASHALPNADKLNQLKLLQERLPITTMDKLDEFENWLKEEEGNYNFLVMEFRRIGGHSHAQLMRRILYRTISNDVAISFSWDGHKQKTAFKSFKLARAIIGMAYELKSVQKCSVEYNRIAMSYNQTLNSLKDSWTIERIDKVLCPYLLAAFLLKEKRKSEIGGNINKMSLYHGTAPVNVPSICASNFNWRLRGTSRGHKFGQGMSFAKRSTYACHYPNTNFSTKTLFVAQVIVGNTQHGSQFMQIPAEGCDATVKPNLDVIVKYDDAEYFPEYVIYYSRSPGINSLNFDLATLKLW